MKFMKKEKKADSVTEPRQEKSRLESAAEREVKRGHQIESLAREANMWREFATDCKSGRKIYENVQSYMFLMERPSFLTCTMDDISAPLWAAFAQQMASVAEKRLKEILG